MPLGVTDVDLGLRSTAAFPVERNGCICVLAASAHDLNHPSRHLEVAIQRSSHRAEFLPVFGLDHRVGPERHENMGWLAGAILDSNFCTAFAIRAGSWSLMTHLHGRDNANSGYNWNPQQQMLLVHC